MKNANHDNSRRTFLKKSMGVVGTAAGTLMGIPVLAQSFKRGTPLSEGLPSSQKSPRQTLGPFFPDDGDPVIGIRENLDFRLPISEANDNDLTTIQGKKGKAKGQVVYIRGKVLLDREGTLKPLTGAVLIEWNASASGRYNHRGDQENTRFQHPLSGEWIERSYDEYFQYWGRCITDANGNYSFKTIIPGFYPVDMEEQWYRPPHLHFMVMAAGVPQLVTQLYFKGEQIPNYEFIHELNAKDDILRSKRMTQAEQESVIIEYTKDQAGLITDGLVGQYDFVLTF
ncbi:dioxygenase family protein [Nitrospira sp. M1]